VWGRGVCFFGGGGGGGGGGGFGLVSSLVQFERGEGVSKGKNYRHVHVQYTSNKYIYIQQLESRWLCPVWVYIFSKFPKSSRAIHKERIGPS